MASLVLRVDDEVVFKLERITEKLDPTMQNKSHVIRDLIHDKYYRLFSEVLDEERRSIYEILDDPHYADMGLEMVKKLLIKAHKEQNGASKPA